VSDEVIFELSDVEVETLGLVNRGANREEFFLMKNAEDQNIESELAISDAITKTVWQRIMGLFQKAAQDVVPNAMLDTEDETEEETEDMEKDTAKESTLTSKTALADPEPVAPEAVIVATAKEDIVTPETVITEPVITVVKEDHMEENVMAENEISKADYEAIAKRLELAETELAKARDEKEQQVWLTKAAGFTYLPIAQAELAGKLYTIAKLDAGLAEWVAEVFKAVDNMVADSGMFVEKGHNIPEVDAVTKAMQAADPKAALLGLPKQEAEAYLAAVRARGRK